MVKYFCILIYLIFIISFCSIPTQSFYKNHQTSFYFNTKWIQESLKKESELFHIVASSQGYDVQQVGFEDTLKWIGNESGNKIFQKEVFLYNKIDYTAESLLQVQFYKGTGKIAKVRFLKTSGVSELDSLILDDLTRWKINYIGEEEVENDKEEEILVPTLVRYVLILTNKTSKKDDKKYLLEQSQKGKR